MNTLPGQPADSPAARDDSAIAPPVPPQDPAAGRPDPVPEIGGRKDGTEPTRFGDWEKNGRCIDF